jgi:hypothetical protein
MPGFAESMGMAVLDQPVGRRLIGLTMCSGIGAPEVAAPWVDWRLAEANLRIDLMAALESRLTRSLHQ